MKTTFTRFFKNCTLLAFLLVSGWATAATYTAVSSGAWSNSSTWAGGLTPGSAPGSLDNIIINSGVDVMLDMDVQFTGLLSSLEVNGSLQSSGDYMLDMGNSALSGTGSLDLQNLRFGTTGSMTFSGDSDIDNLWNSSLALDLSTQMNLNDTLFLDAGSVNIASGSALTLMTGSAIRVDDGTMTLTSGLLNNSNDYSVLYVGTDKNTGLELDGSGLTDVWVDLDDNSQSLSITGDVTIEGMLHHNHGMIDLNGGTLTLMDDYMSMSGAVFVGSATSSLSIQHDAALSSDLMFDASGDELNDLTINMSGTGNAHLGSDLSIDGTLMLEDGDFAMTSGTLTMATGSEIVVKDGHMMNSGGTFDGDNAYNVTYNSTSSTTSGIELTGSGLNDLWIDMDDAADSVELMNAVSVDGELNMNNGGMAMNGYDLTLDGSLTTNSNGWFGGDEDSDLTFNTNSLDNDTIWVNQANNGFGTITINADDASDLMVGSNLRAENINMSTGGMHIWDNEIWMNTTGSITGADEDRYVMIDGSGSLVMNVQVSAPYTMYPVGTDEGYAPVGLQQNSGAAGYFKVNSMNGVWSNGTSGSNYANSQSVVDRTWDINAVNGGSLDLNLKTMWSSGQEVNGFDRTSAYIMHYTGGSWDAQGQTASAAVAVGSMYQLERQNVTSLSPFAVKDDADAGLNENATIVAQLYPNPVQTVLNCTVVVDETATVNVVDMTGKVLHTENVNETGTVNHTIDFSAYPEGVYFVNYTSAQGTGSYRVIKSL